MGSELHAAIKEIIFSSFLLDQPAWHALEGEGKGGNEHGRIEQASLPRFARTSFPFPSFSDACHARYVSWLHIFESADVHNLLLSLIKRSQSTFPFLNGYDWALLSYHHNIVGLTISYASEKIFLKKLTRRAPSTLKWSIQENDLSILTSACVT